MFFRVVFAEDQTERQGHAVSAQVRFSERDRHHDNREAKLAQVLLENVNKSFGSIQVLFDVSLRAEDGEFVVFVGPSGCGKSTLLRSIAGLEQISSGRILIGDEDVTRTPPSKRDVAMVFQSYALYPHMTVRGNIEFGLKVNGVERAQIQRRVEEAARTLRLEDYLDRKPSQLSGGQRQRVAIGRAIVKKPRVFLFDEPLSNLDAALRVQMRVELEGLHSALGATMIYVTHDQVEAMTMADRIVVLNEGRIEQVGAPLDLYHRPATRFVAGFIGAPRMNFLPVEVAGETATGLRLTYGGTHGLEVQGFAAPQGRDAGLSFGIRPEHLVLAPTAEADIPATVQVVEKLGSEAVVYVDTAAGHRLVIKADGETPVTRGEAVGLRIDPARGHLFSADGMALTRRAG
jgi:ABC-type sugar transport system ATPase subunit